jgi:hypothetical protein
MLPIYISFFLSTETRATVQSATAVTAASSKGIPMIKARTRDIRGIFPVKNLSASQKGVRNSPFPFARDAIAALISLL